MTRTGRTIALLGLAGMLVAGCAQPGQLGSAPPATQPNAAATPNAAAAAPGPAPAPTSAAAAAAPAGPVLLGSGRIEDRVTIRTPGPAVFSVRTVVLAPGADTGWHRHPGTEMSIVTSGSVTVLREDDCAGTRYAADAAVFVSDAEPHLVRNDGTEPAELLVTYLLAPDAPDREDVRPAC